MFFVTGIQEAAHGIIPGISREDLLNLYLPIAPLTEQHRIVIAVDAAFSQLDSIMETLQ